MNNCYADKGQVSIARQQLPGIRKQAKGGRVAKSARECQATSGCSNGWIGVPSLTRVSLPLVPGTHATGWILGKYTPSSFFFFCHTSLAFCHLSSLATPLSHTHTSLATRMSRPLSPLGTRDTRPRAPTLSHHTPLASSRDTSP